MTGPQGALPSCIVPLALPALSAGVAVHAVYAVRADAREVRDRVPGAAARAGGVASGGEEVAGLGGG